MPAPELSSNWKQLQARLKKDSPATGAERAKHGTEVTRARTLKRKRPATLSVSSDKRMKMASSPAERPLEPAVDLPTIASPIGPAERNAGLIPETKAGRYIALDCEMVSTRSSSSRLARVSVVNYHLQVVYDSFVLPEVTDPVVDYRTSVSGIHPTDLRKGYARPMRDVQMNVQGLLSGRVLVGHALRNDLEALGLKHSGATIRDTAKCTTFRAFAGGRSPALRELSRRVLGVSIQGAEHCSVVDARAAMELYKREKKAIDDETRKRYGPLVARRGSAVLNGSSPEMETSDAKHVLLEGEAEKELLSAIAGSATMTNKRRGKIKRKHKSRTTRA